VAIVLLVVAFLDLGATMSCCADDLGLPVTAAGARGVLASDVAEGRGHDQVTLPASDERSPLPTTGTGGCFCCALAIPAALRTTVVASACEPVSPPHGLSLPSSTPTVPSPPPRLA